MPNGIVTITSDHSVNETVSRIEALLAEKKIKLFCVVDHSGEAARAGLEMLPAKLLIFGNPLGGTPVMVAAPDAALDLPLKLLISETAGGKVEISWNDAVWLQERHGFPPELAINLAAAETLARAAAA